MNSLVKVVYMGGGSMKYSRWVAKCLSIGTRVLDNNRYHNSDAHKYILIPTTEIICGAFFFVYFCFWLFVQVILHLFTFAAVDSSDRHAAHTHTIFSVYMQARVSCRHLTTNTGACVCVYVYVYMGDCSVMIIAEYFVLWLV